ncbi:MAG: von Willebrand factor type, partial [Thermoleophilia bacterium]|nr:von Willebrand factor type [Thermoleophilia bacterium]
MNRIACTLAATATVVIGVVAAVSVPLASATTVRTDTGGGVSITRVDASNFPTVRVAFGADDVAGDTPRLDFYEDGERLPKATLYRGPIGKYENKVHTDLMLALDTSLSMGAGTRMADATAAAKVLLEHAGPEDNVGLVTFGGAARVVVPPTTDRGRIDAALDSITLQNRTTMFDAVSIAAQAFDKDSHNTRAIVLLSDGTDAGSVETRDEAAGEALKANAPVLAVAIRERTDDQPRDMAALGNGTGGELQTVVGTAGLDQLFDDLGRRILQPYWMEYRSAAPRRSMVDVGIAAGGGAIDAHLAFRAVPSTTASGRTVTAPRAADAPPAPLIPLPTGLLGVLLAAVPFGALIFFGTWRFLEKRSRPDVIKRIERYTTQASSTPSAASRKQEGSALRRMVSPVVSLGDSLLGTSGFFERTRFRADQAAIAIKPGELFAAMVVMAGFGLAVGLLTGNLILIIALPLVLGFLPNFWLRMKARRRRNAFEGQLADVLGAIASSLKAGHSFNQALNAMIRDT